MTTKTPSALDQVRAARENEAAAGAALTLAQAERRYAEAKIGNALPERLADLAAAVDRARGEVRS